METKTRESFDLTLLKNFYDRSKNLVLSPFSIEICLSMLAEGMKYNGYKVTRLFTDNNRWDLAEIQRDQIVRLRNNKNSTVKVANSLWLRNVNEKVSNFFEEDWFAEVSLISDAKAINSWCESNTDGMINHIIDEIDEKVGKILVNALFFKGTWLTKFNTENTKKETFHGTGGNNQVDFMYQYDTHYAYYEDEGVLNLELKYEGYYKPCVLRISMPKVPIDEYLRLIERENPAAWRSTDMNLHFPKFTLESSLDVKELLEKLGINKVEIGKVLHKSKIEVEEEGTKAAAITYAEVYASAACYTPKPIEVRIDKPFIFKLVDQLTETTLFVGVVNNL